MLLHMERLRSSILFNKKQQHNDRCIHINQVNVPCNKNRHDTNHISERITGANKRRYK